MKAPEMNALCWLYCDGRPQLCRVFHVTPKYYSATNVEAYVSSRGEYVPAGELFTLPPGYPNDTWAPYIEGQPAPEFKLHRRRGYYVPADMPPKPTPLF